MPFFRLRWPGSLRLALSIAPLALTAVDELAREAIELCQHDCDQIRDQVIYGVYVRHFLNDLEPCARWLIRLQPSNVEMEPIYVPAAQVAIQGRVLGVLRRYR